MLEVENPVPISHAKEIQAVVLDWAGTVVDFGSRAPVMAVLTAFEQAGVPVSEKEARQPMGRAKRDHLNALLTNPSIAGRWQTQHGRPSTEQDLDEIYAYFLAVQAESVAECSPVIPGCVDAIAECRAMGIKIGSSTGYTHDLLAPVAKRAESEGFKPDVMLSADDISPGRPAPWLIYENARRLGVQQMSAIVKVDDTQAGVSAGRNAGVWSIGVVDSGNEVGLSESDLATLPKSEKIRLQQKASLRLINAGAHILIDSIVELPAAVKLINSKLQAGCLP